MSDKGWKAFERRIARVLGGARRGAYTGGSAGGKTDIVHDAWGVECKLLARSGHADILSACRQAEANSNPPLTPIAIVKRKNDRDQDSIVAMRLEVWLEWFGPTDETHPPVEKRNGGRVTS